MLDGQSPLQHLAIILDGNGRWAERQGLPRSAGHLAGGKALERLLDALLSTHIPVVSLYAFSTENWKRPSLEIKALWRMMDDFFETRLHRCHEKGIQMRVSGDIDKIPPKNRAQIEHLVGSTASYNNLTVNFCVNYGSKEEILQACGKLLQRRLWLSSHGKEGEAAAPIEEAEFETYLYTSGLPQVDLLIRSGGESRISNFLLWQCAYAEIYITDILWPDFSSEELKAALRWYQSRKRRFGGLG